jgi:hypothetical protein
MTKFKGGKSRSFAFKDLPVGRDNLDLPHVKTVRSKGRVYHYFNTGSGYVSLPRHCRAAFADAYRQQVREREMPKTVGQLIRAYERSADFERLSPTTKKVYWHHLREIARYKDARVGSLTSDDLRHMIEGRGQNTAKGAVKVASTLYSWARRQGFTSHDPASGIFARERKPQWIYFVGAGDGEPIKIGRANNIKQRLSMIQSGNPKRLRVLASFFSDDSIATEQAYHDRFAAHRLHGEWFAPHPDILAEIARLTPSLT